MDWIMLFFRQVQRAVQVEWRKDISMRLYLNLDDIVARECELAQQMYRESIDRAEQETEEKIR